MNFVSLSIILFTIIPKHAHSFSFNLCNVQFNECLKTNETEYFNQANFTSETINNLFINNGQRFNTVKIYPENDAEIRVNVDNIISSITIIFEKRNLSNIIIETNVDESFQMNHYPSLDANNLDIIIDNVNSNNQNDRTPFVFRSIKCNRFYPKNPSKPLYLFQHDEHLSSLPLNFNAQTVYVGYAERINLNNFTDKNLTIISAPIVRDQKFSNSFTINVPENLSITYGQKEIEYKYPNGNILTIKSETNRLNVINEIQNGTIITVKNGLLPNDLISPSLKVDNTIASSSQTLPKIEGIWPIIKSDVIDGYYLNDGTEIKSFERSFEFDGTFLFSAVHYPAKYLTNELILVSESLSSIYLVDERLRFQTFKILNSNTNDFFFEIEGNWPYFDYYEQGAFIHTNSTQLTLYRPNNRFGFAHIGNATIITKNIVDYDSTSPIDIQRGNTIQVPFTLDIDTFWQNLTKIYDDFIETNGTRPENATVSELANHYINFVKNEIAEIAPLINGLKHETSPVYINIIDNKFSTDKNTTINVLRRDIPLSSLYKNGLNDPMTLVCINNVNEAINLSFWDIRVGYNILRNLFDDTENGEIFTKFIPSFADTNIGASISTSNNGKCITMNETRVPGSSFEIVVFTTNDTLIEILSQIEIITTVTPDDMDATRKLNSMNSKNILVLVLDDVPEGMSINLKGLRIDSNLIVVGYQSNKIEDIFNLVNDLEDEEKNSDELLFNIISKHNQYHTKMSLLIDYVDSLFFCLIDYKGTSIRCGKFHAILCTFDNVNDFNADTAVTDSSTYKLISKFTFNDLFVYPFVFNKSTVYSILSIGQINFTSTQLNIAFVNDNRENFTVLTENIKGRLTLVSSSKTGFNLNVPHNITGQTVKGVKVISGFSSFADFDIRELPGIVTLEERNHQSDFYRSLSKSIKTFSKSRLNLLEENEGENTNNAVFNFTGFWDSVENVDGEIGLNLGESDNTEAVLNNVPEVVLNRISVNGGNKITIDLKNDVGNVRFKEQTTITNKKTYNFRTNSKQKADSNINVSFYNLTFDGGLTGLSITQDNKPIPFTADHISLKEKSNTIIDGSEFEINDSINIWPETKLEITNSKESISPLNLTFNYRLSEQFNSFSLFDKISPKEVVFNYIGENDNIDEFVDYNNYNLNQTLITLRNETQCDEWKNKSHLVSRYYVEFRENNGIVSIICDSEKLNINFASVPRGDIEIESVAAVFPGKSKNKKKLSTGAIVGIVIGCIALLVIIALLVWYFAFYKKKKDKENVEVSDKEDYSVGL